MNFIYGFLLAFGCAFIGVSGYLKCSLTAPDVPTKWRDMADPCIQAMKDQVQTEVNASITYLAMGAYFAQDNVNRPGFSKLFFESASEEREHALKIIESLLMRGELLSNIGDLLKFPLKPKGNTWISAYRALKDALILETEVTKSIRNIIKVCEIPVADGTNDYFLADYLASDFLGEQYKGQRDLAGKASTLGKMMETHGPLGEFLFDKKLLNGEI